MSDELDRE
jgi:hypothetical protein